MLWFPWRVECAFCKSPVKRESTAMDSASPQVELKCTNCRHDWRNHGPHGCRVTKAKWDSEANSLVMTDSCECKWAPPKDLKPVCPHEVQDQAYDPDVRHSCVHCGVHVK